MSGCAHRWVRGGLIASLAGCGLVCRAQYVPPDGVYPDRVFAENIKTVRLHKLGWEFSYPVVRMDDDDPLELTFDELSETARSYAYAIVHCDADWKQSRLVTSDYMSGFETNYLPTGRYSFNTHISYVHYRLTLPNDDARPVLSGNYALVVFEDGNENEPVLCKRFSISESAASVLATAGRARQTMKQEEWQQVNFTVQTGSYPVESPYQEVKIAILQNGVWGSAVTGIKPMFVRPGELDYRYDDAVLFAAGNEYRPLDLKNTRYASTDMAAIRFEKPTYHFYPKPDEERAAGRYFFYEDFNGRYMIAADRIDDPDVGADYVYVHFALDAPEPLDGDVYVVGAFSNNDADNRMSYNAERRQYEATVLLKQGYYNYQYALAPREHPQILDPAPIEGDFRDTENDYIIYVYHRGRMARYDRLIGFTIVNSFHH